MNLISVQEWLTDSKYAELRKEYYSVKLNCGHLPSDPSLVYETGDPMTTGYGTDRDGRKYCHECCAQRDIALMKCTGEADLYLSQRGNALVISTWPGKVISQRVLKLKEWRNNFGDYRVAVRFTFNGEIWSGIGPGPGQYLRCKRTKYARLDA